MKRNSLAALREIAWPHEAKFSGRMVREYARYGVNKNMINIGTIKMSKLIMIFFTFGFIMNLLKNLMAILYKLRQRQNK